MNHISKFKLAACQVRQSRDKSKCLEYAQQSIEEATKNGANFLVLGECWNCAADRKNNAEELNEKSTTLNFLKTITKNLGIFLVAGSIPELDDKGTVYNTSLILNKGEVLGKYRKTHLFDIDMPGKMVYKESATFGFGDSFSVLDTEFGKIGVSICFDVRFPEVSMLMAAEGAKILILPGNFTLTTGPLHWELLLRSRAVDNQVYVVGCSTARLKEDTTVIQAYGHSMIVDPLGKVLAEAGEDPEIIYADIDLKNVEDARSGLPYQNLKRKDLYNLTYKMGSL